ncbi:MAG: hypothetical protein OES13_00725 [Acidimicrobiia bacterium]|nr:hypothetical protein [Acidimicrobiia bacterium]
MKHRYFWGGLALVGVVLLPLPGFPTLAGGGTAIVTATDVESEDYYALAGKVIVEGSIEGDLIVVTEELIITGEVTGDVLGVVWGDARIGGEVGGSVRLAAQSLTTDGVIGDDLVVATFSGRLGGEVGRDVLTSSYSIDLTASVGRDVRGQIYSFDLNGDVERNLDVTVNGVQVGAGTSVGGDLVYKSNRTGTISGGADFGGQVVRQRVRYPIQIRAIQSLVGVLSLLAFLVTGVVLFWLMRRTLPRAAVAIEKRPWRSFAIGVAAMVVTPFVAVALAVTLVGLPLALALMGLWLGALFVGPIPAVTAAVDRLSKGRFGLLGSFFVGAVLWRSAMWLIPFVGSFLYILAVFNGVGGWLVGGWESRREEDRRDLPPLSATPRHPEVPENWEAPLPPELPAPPAVEASDAVEPEEPEPGV